MALPLMLMLFCTMSQTAKGKARRRRPAFPVGWAGAPYFPAGPRAGRVE
jgi:hypothetical protein